MKCPEMGKSQETFLVVQWLRLCAFNTGGTGSVLQYRGWGTKTPHAVWHSQKVKILKKKLLLQDRRGWKLRVKGRRMGPEAREEDRRTAPATLEDRALRDCSRKPVKGSYQRVSQSDLCVKKTLSSGRPVSMLLRGFQERDDGSLV